MFFSQIYLAMFLLGAAIFVYFSWKIWKRGWPYPTFQVFSELSVHQKLKKNLLQVVKNPNEEIHIGFYYL